MENEPLVEFKKTRRRGPGKKQKLEVDLSKTLKETFLQSKALEGALKVAPDLFILGGGFYLGYVMNMRPGVSLPGIPVPIVGSVGGGYVGLPDFGARIDELKTQVKAQENRIESLKKSATVIERDADCVAFCEEARRLHARVGEPFDMEACLKGCEKETETLTPSIEEAEMKLATLNAELLKHRIAQGVLMSTLIYAFSRPGFLQGIGEIIPG